MKSIKAKLCLFFGGLLFIICVGMGSIVSMQASNTLTVSVNDQLSKLSNEAVQVVQSSINVQFGALEVLSANDSIRTNKLTINEKLEVLKPEVKRSGHLRMGIADPAGKAQYTDGSSVDVAERDYFKKALTGERAISDPIVSKVDNSVVLCYAVPIKDNDHVTGVLIATRDGNELSTLTDNIHLGKNEEAFMVNSKGTTVAHKNRDLVIKMDNNLENVSKDPELKFLADIIKQMSEGKESIGEYRYKGITKYAGFAPVNGTDWSLAITSPKADVMAKVNGMAIGIVIISIVFILGGIVVTYLIASYISKPIKMISEHLGVLATGDFTVEVSPELLEVKGEMGTLAKAMNTMQKSIREIVKNVAYESSNVKEMLAAIKGGMTKLNKSIEEISATTQQLSAGTEETAASTEEMNATSVELERAVESIASKVQESVVTVSDVSSTAENMKKNAISSKESATEIYQRTKINLKSAIEKSKAVTQINELSESILAITSQTNLLALNAAIESARAGEAGKGFAVVAEEIRKLADHSKNTVTRIQDVNKIILEAVQSLSDGSDEILAFIDEHVLKDYEYLVTVSDQYGKNSSDINDMITDLSSTSEELLASIENMAKGIDEITSASNEEANGASSIAQEATSIAHMSNEVIKLSEESAQKSDLLIKTVSSFKV